MPSPHFLTADLTRSQDHTYLWILAAGSTPTMSVIDSGRSQGWHDFSLFVEDFEQFEKRHAGRVETGADGITASYMGWLV